MQIQRGQRGKLEGQFDINMPVTITMQTIGSAVYDYCCFGVDAADQLSDDRYMVFYNQPRTPKSEITHFMDDSRAVYHANLTQLPDSIQKLVFTVSIDGAGTMGNISRFEVTISQEDCEPIILQLAGTDFAEEKAIITFEIYRKNGWRYSAVARGFNGGLGDLLRSYGGEEITDTPDVEKENPAPDLPEQDFQTEAEPLITHEQFVQQNTVLDTSSQQPLVIHSALQEQAVLEQPKTQNTSPTVQSAIQQNTTPVVSEQSSAEPPKKVDLLKLGNKPVNLKKNEKVELRKPNDEILKKVVVGLGWDPARAGMNIDCDSSVFMCQGGKLRSRNDIIAFYNKCHSSGAVLHHGDNLTGDGAGDDERITIDLTKMPPTYDRIVIVVNIFLSLIKMQHFGKIKNCYMRICDQKGKELCRYTLSENGEYNKKSAMIFGELLKQDDVWVFHAIGQGTNDHSIDRLAARFK